jgi:Tfp pilus assembly protein PilP
MRSLLLSCVVLFFTAVPAAPQAPAPLPQATAPEAAAAPAPPPVETFTYNPDGRRDPFVSLISRGSEHHGAQGIEGIAGLAVDDLSVRGIVSSRGGYVAMVQGPDGKTYLVRQNDRLLDGTVKAVTPQGLVILQDVNDPLSLVKQKEVRKMLHGNEEGK